MNEIKKPLSALLASAGRSMDFKYKGGELTILGVTDDTREVGAGYIFVCVKGEHFDGHTAAADMIKLGAAAVVCDRDLGLKDKQIIVADTRRFYGLLVAEWFGHPEKELILVGVTGTNGKTTMTSMIYHILTFAGARAGLIGTTGVICRGKELERDTSTPTTPRVYELYSLMRKMVEMGCKYCVMEVTSFALDQNRIGPAIFTCGVFTNLTQDHLDYHGTLENYYNAKKKLFTDHCRIAFINTEDKFGEKLYREITCPKYSYGLNGGTSISAGYISFDGMSTHFRFVMPGKTYPFSMKMMGSYNVSNAVAAIAVCLKLNVPMQAVTEALRSFKGVRGRCEMIPTGKDFIIICDYAHSPDAIENMLSSIKETANGRLICLFGCGGDRDRTKRPLMAKAAAKHADCLIITSDNPRNEDPDDIIDEILMGLEGSSVPYERITDRKEAIFHAIRTAKKNDVIVLAGKGHEDYQILKDDVHIHFDEREICAEALKELSVVSANHAELCIGMSLDEIADACGGSLCEVPDSSRFINTSCISSDTRNLTAGSVFIALKGPHYDGHSFVRTAKEKGALASITEHPVDECPCIVVESTHRALLSLAAHYRNKFTPKLVGVTGSVGKTTTKEMIYLALSSKYYTLKTEENHNNEIGMPFTLMGLTPSHKAAVIEMGMSNFGEIERLSKTSRPSVAVITNIGWSHAENLGSTQEGVLKAKLEILKGAEPDAPLIINGDDPLLLPLKDTITNRRVITCGVNNKDCTYYAEDIVSENGTTSFTVCCEGEKLDRITLGCIGKHHIADALLAYAAGIAAECDGAAIAEKLSAFALNGLRQHMEQRRGQTLIIDCYNAAPASMKAAIDVLCETEPVSGGKRVAVLGDMLELGSLSPQLHESIGEYVAEKNVDILVCYGDYSAYMAKKAEALGVQCCHSSDKQTILNYLGFKLKEGDVVLFKASRGMHMEEIIEEYYSSGQNNN